MAKQKESPWKTVLMDNREFLENDLVYKDIKNRLLQERVISDKESQDITHNAPPYEQTSNLVDKMCKKDADAYCKFLNCIKKLKGQGQIYRTLNAGCSCEVAREWEREEIPDSDPDPDPEPPLKGSDFPLSQPVTASQDRPRIEEMIALMNEKDLNIEDIKIQKASEKLIDNVLTKDIYSIRSSVRGRALIIANCQFGEHTGLDDIATNKADASLIEQTLIDLQFIVEIKSDKTAEEIHDILEDENKKQLECYDVFVLVVLSHGGQRFVYGIDQEKVYLDNEDDNTGIFSYFFGDCCTALQGKPKLFFIQACQSEIEYQPKQETCGDEELDSPNATLDAVVWNTNPHKQAHTVKLISSCPGDAAFANADLGGWFMRAVIIVLRKCAHDTEIQEMCNIIQEILSTLKTEDGEHQMAPYIPTLGARKFYFLPGYEGKNAQSQQQPTDNEAPSLLSV